jgi:hypothetical protein
VLLRPENRPDGFGGAGYYRVRLPEGGKPTVQRVPTKETIHVFVDVVGALRADHDFAFTRVRFVTLRYGTHPATFEASRRRC